MIHYLGSDIKAPISSCFFIPHIFCISPTHRINLQSANHLSRSTAFRLSLSRSFLLNHRLLTKAKMSEIRDEKPRATQRPPRQLAVHKGAEGMAYGPTPHFVYCFFFDAVEWIDTAGWNCPQCGVFVPYYDTEAGVTKPEQTGKLYEVRECTNALCKPMFAYRRDPTPEEMARETIGVIDMITDILKDMVKRSDRS